MQHLVFILAQNKLPLLKNIQVTKLYEKLIFPGYLPGFQSILFEHTIYHIVLMTLNPQWRNFSGALTGSVRTPLQNCTYEEMYRNLSVTHNFFTFHSTRERCIISPKSCPFVNHCTWSIIQNVTERTFYQMRSRWNNAAFL